jgi:hypothetical protein
VLFVSHNLGAIRRLCEGAILLEHGRLVAAGPPSDVVAEYMARALPEQSVGRSVITADQPRMGTGEARVVEVGLTSEGGEPLAALHLEQPFRIVAAFAMHEQIEDAVVEFGITSLGGDRIATVQSIDREGPLLEFARGRHEVAADIDATFLPGEFTIDVGIHHRSGVTIDYVQEACRFTALNAAEQGADSYPWTGVRGFTRPRSRWNVVHDAEPVATNADSA